MSDLEEANVQVLKLERDSELRLQIRDKNAKISVKLINGFAEMFGTELVENKNYEFFYGTEAAIFTYVGCTLKVIGKADEFYISKETSMGKYLNCHAALEQMRKHAEEKDANGPIAMIVGPIGVGKSTLCRILLNYAVRAGRRPLYVDIDIGYGNISLPGTISAMLIEKTANIETGFIKTAPLVYHFGHNALSDNNILYKNLITKLAQVSIQTMKANKKSKYSGIIINTCSWVKGDGYKQLLCAARAYQVKFIFVLHDKRLYTELLNDLPTFVNIILLSKSDGLAESCSDLRAENRSLRIYEYFYGFRIPLKPFLVVVKFEDLQLYKINAPTTESSWQSTEMKLTRVVPNLWLRYHLLAVSFAKSTNEDVIFTSVSGFVCVTKVGMQKQEITILSPQPGPLPNNILLCSDVLFWHNEN